MSDLQISYTFTTSGLPCQDEHNRLAMTYRIGERQMQHAFQIAMHQPGDPGENMLILLERRLDNLIVRAGFAPDIWTARQIVTHHHVIVDGRPVGVPSFRVRPSQRIKIHPRKVQPLMLLQYRTAAPNTPPYLDPDPSTISARLVRLPMRDEIPCDVDEHLVTQYYMM
jgi:small subunit ribosomal protein S4